MRELDTAIVDCARIAPWAPPRPPWQRITPLIIAALCVLAYLVIGLNRYTHYLSTGYDLGIFDQVVGHYAGFDAPVSELKGTGFNILGDHFSPIFVLFVPLYWLIPGPQALIIGQALLIGASVRLVSRAAARELGSPWIGAVISAAYGCSWGVLSAITFDVHEVAFACLFLAICLDQILQRRWNTALVWALPLVLVKEDLGLTAAAIGLVFFLNGQRWQGVLLAAYGVTATVISITVIIPALSTYGRYTYADSAGPGRSSLSEIITQPQRRASVLALLVIVLALPLGSKLSLVALPTVVWRLTSDNSGYWATDNHYSLILMPIIFLALIDVLQRLQKRPMIPDKLIRVSALAVLAIAGVFVATSPALKALNISSCPRCDAITAALNQIPDNARVAASNYVAPPPDLPHHRLPTRPRPP